MLNRLTIGAATLGLTFASAGAALALPRTAASPELVPNAARLQAAIAHVGPIRRGIANPGNVLLRLGARYAGLAHGQFMTVDVSTAMRNSAGLRAYAEAASTPGSRYYRHWITPQQIADSFGTPATDYATAAAYFKSYGLAVKTWTPRTMLAVTGSQANLEKALGTKFGTFILRGHRFYAAVGPYAMPASLGVTTVGALTNTPVRTTHSLIAAPPQPISGGFDNSRVNGLSPANIAQAYDYTGAYAAGFTGKGINLGIIGTGPISAMDVPTYKKIYKVPGSGGVSLAPVTVNGDSTPPPVTGPCTDGSGGTSENPTPTCNPEDVEAQLDTEQTAGLAYDANILFYLAYNGSGCTVAGSPTGGCVGNMTSPSQGLAIADDEVMQAVSDNKADILSLSYGGCEVLESALGSLTVNPGSDATGLDVTLFQMAASQGIATFVSSGDTGSAECQRAADGAGGEEANISYPSDLPTVVSVGGTTTPVGPDGRLTGPITNWGEQTQSGGAAGAGLSTDFTTPSYESAQPSSKAICTMRCNPDVALDADPFTGAAVIFDSFLAPGSEEPIGGTSQAAPDMAAMWALVLSACNQTASCKGPVSGGPAYRMGNPNPLWYPLLAASKAAAYRSTFYDVVYGNDAVPTFANQTAAAESGTSAYAAGVDPGSVSAGPGFDNASGIGAPFARGLIKTFVGV